MRRPVLVTAALATAALATLTATLTTVPAGAEGGSSLAEVRRATAKYHDVEAALADGFVPTEGCVAIPDVGAMGVHYLHPARLQDPDVDPRRPEMLLYEPQADGTLELVGVEWFSVDPDQDVTTDDGRPSLFGQGFDGPMPGHEEGMPIHFDLHAWIWRNHPNGRFAPWNPAVRCP